MCAEDTEGIPVFASGAFFVSVGAYLFECAERCRKIIGGRWSHRNWPNVGVRSGDSEVDGAMDTMRHR